MVHKIAIIGIGCRFPGGVSNPDEYWRFLESGADAVREVPTGRWPANVYDADPATPGRSYVRRGGFLADPGFSFDAAFFGISPREAETLDPQQRLLLEVVWEALEDAGVTLKAAQQAMTGVFVGGFTLDSMLLRFRNLDLINNHTPTSSSMTLLSNRISYTFDFNGPSMTVDTACSSSLVATHLAARALQEGECHLALAGGVNLMLLPDYQVMMCKGRFLAADGRSKTFDASADGYGRGEGAGIVLLKRLDDALRDGDHIYAVLAGSGVNQDGATDGIAQPSAQAQQALIRAVCQRYGLDPAQVGYIEAHGTGTALGDPIEVSALASVYGRPQQAAQPRLGSVKANFGHLEAAAGIAGLIKATLAVHARTIPPHRMPRQLNPVLQLEQRGLQLAARSESWPLPGPAVAVVNSFGYGGTNAHAWLEQAPPRLSAAVPPASGGAAADTGADAEAAMPLLLPLSARGEDALRARAGQIASMLEEGESLAGIASTLARKRSALPTRAAVPCADPDAAILALRKLEEKGLALRYPNQAVQRMVWVYSGMGPQWAGMGREIWQRPAFRSGWQQACAALARHGLDIQYVMEQAADSIKMERNDVAQPCNFALQVGLTCELRSHGLQPDAVLGHSTGEMAAAWAAGALTLDDAACVVAVRTRLQQSVAGGSMLAVGLSADELQPYLAGIQGVAEIAAFNAANSLTLAGDRDTLAALEERLNADGHFAKPVRVEVAYHSSHMAPVEKDLQAQLAHLQPQMPTLPLYSTVTGQRVRAVTHDAAYWWRNTRGAVHLAHAVQSVCADGQATFLQLGPHPVLAPALTETGGANARALALLQRDKPEIPGLLQALAALWQGGVELDWTHLAPPHAPHTLPSYPWQRRRFWRELPVPEGAANHPLLAERQDAPQPAWGARIDGARWAWLQDHHIDGTDIVPGAMWLEALLAAEILHSGQESAVLSDVEFPAALMLAESGQTQTLRTILEAGLWQVHARTLTPGEPGDTQWRLHGQARRTPASRWKALTQDAGGWDAQLQTWQHKCVEQVDVPALYAALAKRGFGYGPAFRGIRSLWRGKTRVLAQIQCDTGPAYEDAAGFFLPPHWLDAAFQALLALRPDDERTMLPVGLERLHFAGRPAPGPWWVLASVRDDDGETLRGDLQFHDCHGHYFCRLLGLQCIALAQPGVPDNWWHGWQWQSAATTPAASAGTVRQLWRLAPAFDPCGLDLLQQIRTRVQQGGSAAQEVVLVTRNAWLLDGDANCDPAHAAVWGMARVVMSERPELGWRLLDVDSAAEYSDQQLLDAIGDEEEAALRGAQRLIGRLVRAGAENLARRSSAQEVLASSACMRLLTSDTGSLDGLRFVSSQRHAPGVGEVEVEIEAAALNFKDVMKALGLLDGNALQASYLGSGLGMEAMGKVLRVGSGCDFYVGQMVLICCGASIRSHVIVDANFVLPCPPEWGMQEAASFFVTMTAWHALVDIGRIRPGDTVLIHSAAGGVGLAAVGIAHAFGARVIATAGTARKRTWLREQGLVHVFDSRSLDFADAALAATGGRGVNLVLNALAGPAIEQGLRCLAPGGHFLELGKKDLTWHRMLSMGGFNRRLSFSAIDLDRAATEDPGYFQPLAKSVLAAFADGRLTPLPARVFVPNEVVAAFRTLSGGDWIGKIVIAIRQGKVNLYPDISANFTPRAGWTWLLTGGLSGFGLELADALAQVGVTHLMLVSRRGKVTPDDQERFDTLLARPHLQVSTRALDVADAGAVQALVQELQASPAPLGGIVHAATVYADAALAVMSEQQLADSLAAKAGGAWNLHQASLQADLDGFVMCSSISAQVGNPGQAGYAAANSFLDGLAQLRQSMGLPGTAVALGALDEVGLVARDAGTQLHLRNLGLNPMPVRLAVAGVLRAMAEQQARIALCDIDWDQWMRAHPATPWQRLTELRGKEQLNTTSLAEQLAALAPAQRAAHALAALREVAAPVFRTEADNLDTLRPLRDQGLDSLMALELSVALRRGLGFEVSSMDLLGGRSLHTLAERLLAGSAAPAPSVVSLPPAVEPSLSEGDLRARICVEAPYEALLNLRQEGKEVQAEVTPVVLFDEGEVSAAELGRHLAILGSMACAVMLGRSERHAYPVHTAEIEMEPGDGPPLSRVKLSATPLLADLAGGKAAAETMMTDMQGRVLGRMKIGYHMMTMRNFLRMFVQHAQITPPGPDPYQHYHAPQLVESGKDSLILSLPDVHASDCLGHFAGLPAMPVSILGRHVFAAAGLAASRFDHLKKPRLLRAKLETFRFVWAGEAVRLFVARHESAWRCQIMVGKEKAARFDLWLREAAQ